MGSLRKSNLYRYHRCQTTSRSNLEVVVLLIPSSRTRAEAPSADPSCAGRLAAELNLAFTMTDVRVMLLGSTMLTSLRLSLIHISRTTMRSQMCQWGTTLTRVRRLRLTALTHRMVLFD